MKRLELVRHLEWVSTVPRHREIKEYLASKICRDLQIPDLRKEPDRK